MKKALWMVLLAWTAGYALPGHTEGNGHDLLGQCTQAVNSFSGTVDPATINFMDAGRCIGQVDGFAGAAAFYESQEGAPGAICFPETGMTVKQSIPLVLQYLESHPEQLHESATVLIFGTFLSSYPCN
jgi:hypothetical protein